MKTIILVLVSFVLLACEVEVTKPPFQHVGVTTGTGAKPDGGSAGFGGSGGSFEATSTSSQESSSESSTTSTGEGGMGSVSSSTGLSVCEQNACMNSGAECGTINSGCPGNLQIDCGECSVGYDLCGDTAPNLCGHVCLTSYEMFCDSMGLPHQYGVLAGCKHPYKMDNGEPYERPNGTNGCLSSSMNGTAILCCS
jgi:hypothetical protein